MNRSSIIPGPLTTAALPSGGLAALGEVQLGSTAEQILQDLRTTTGGPSAWRLRKAAELRELFALAAISGRLKIEWLDASTDLRVVLSLRAPVPLRGAQPDAPMTVGPFSRLGLTYRQEVMTTPQPGYSFAQILAPREVWHPNCSRDAAQVLCMGNLPIGVPLREVILIAYGALTMQTVQFSASDPAGVLNPAATEWWQQNIHRIPLSREPFILNSQPRS